MLLAPIRDASLRPLQKRTPKTSRGKRSIGKTVLSIILSMSVTITGMATTLLTIGASASTTPSSTVTLNTSALPTATASAALTATTTVSGSRVASISKSPTGIGLLPLTGVGIVAMISSCTKTPTISAGICCTTSTLASTFTSLSWAHNSTRGWGPAPNLLLTRGSHFRCSPMPLHNLLSLRPPLILIFQRE